MVEYSVLEDDFDEEPEDVTVSSFSFGDYELVGHGKVTNERCGLFLTYGCVRTELHNKVIFDKEGRPYDCSGKAYLKRVFCSCDKPSCPICFKRGWAKREAFKIEQRLNEYGKYPKGYGRFGLIEHVIASVPPKDYGLELEDMRKKAFEVLEARGVIGGSMIFHGARHNHERHYWYFSPHFHALCFIRGGYKCRGCKKVLEVGKCGIENRGCDGFVNRSYRCNEKDSWIVKVKGKRKTVGGTAWYQLNHATIKKDSVRFHVSSWFGVCSYRRMKVAVADMKREHVCPICEHELTKIWYSGSQFDRWIAMSESESLVDAVENGREVCEVVVSGSFG